MALSETIFVDKCEVVSVASTHITNGQKAISLQVRTADVVLKDGVELSRSFVRHQVTPGRVLDGSTTITPTDYSSEDPLVKTMAEALFTSDVIEGWRQYVVGIRSDSSSSS